MKNSSSRTNSGGRRKFSLSTPVLLRGIGVAFSVYLIIFISHVPAHTHVLRELERERRNEFVNDKFRLIPGFQRVLERAKKFKGMQGDLISKYPQKADILAVNRTNETDLPLFGIIDALSSYQPSSMEEYGQWQCSLPPATECNETKFTVIMQGYRVDRLTSVRHEIRKIISGNAYGDMVKEFIFVWNNPVSLAKLDNNAGQVLLDWNNCSTNPFHKSRPNPFRLFLPLEQGFPNDLMNRYHPMIRPKSKAILFYDDDGPFYLGKAIHGAFELWKRNSDAQLGAMPRAFTFSKRQEAERAHVMGEELDDRKFVSYCPKCGDVLKYDFRFFTPFHANMVLPSGSFLHRNYLCFIWHPALEIVRQFVRDHSVHPDDMTISTIVSQLNGRSPLTYSRRLPEPKKGETQGSMRRRLLWDDVSQDEWSNRRSRAVNSITGFFGSVTTGSVGWCYKTPFHKVQKNNRHICDPEIAKNGMLPWLQEGGFRNDICPINTSPPK